MIRQTPFLLVLLSIIASAGAAKWDYVSAKYGVDAWSKNFPACNGTSQSPIDLRNPTRQNLGRIKFTNYGAIPAGVNVTAKNNGHSFVVTFDGFTDSTSPTISGAGLPGVFKLVQYHLHWGNDDTLGSEHHVDSTAYPAELHLVHLNTKYTSLSVGVTKADGLAVLGVFCQRGTKKNEAYDFLNQMKYNVTYQDMTSKLQLSTLMALLPTNQSFYRYSGSLTTPKCQQAVTWTVFANPVVISQEEFFALRDMKYIDINNTVQPLVNNYRPIQPLNGRTVLFSDTIVSAVSPTKIPNYFIFIATLLPAVFLTFSIEI